MGYVSEMFEDAFDEFRDDLKNDLEDLGARATQDCKLKGAYTDRTGNLRASNKYEVIANDEETSLILENTAEYASFVEAKGFNVMAETTLMIENELQ